MGKIKITDSFWTAKQELVRKEVIPYQWNALNDNVPGAAPSYCMRNFKLAGAVNEKRKQAGFQEEILPVPKEQWEFTPNNSAENSFHGWVFQDTDVYKWLEAVGYSLENHPDPELESTADAAIELIANAQLPDGYLDTLYVINNPEKRLENLRDKHELYCFGHLCEGALAYYHATGKRKILDVTIRFADFLYTEFVEKDKKGYPGHEIAEMALAKLYTETGDKKYQELAQYFIDHRGEKPYYFDKEFGKETGEELRYYYNQAHLPVRQQKEAVGHAVRAVYLYSGMADIAAQTRDESLMAACRTIFDNIISRKMYITGGIGSTHAGEAFTSAYDLPNDMAYSETCASIGLMFFAKRMLKMERNSKYADAMERALYNCVLSGMAADGKSFFYVNPLEVIPSHKHGNPNMDFVRTVRQKWFGCACCPPNIARLLSSLGDYIITEDKAGVYVDLYIAGNAELSDGRGNISIDADLSKSGVVKITAEHTKDYCLGVRIPSWSPKYKLFVKEERERLGALPSGRAENDNILRNVTVKDGYIYVNIESDTEITLEFDIEPKFISCNNRVAANAGKVAVMRGPVVYCVEEKDNGSNLHLLSVDTKVQPVYMDGVVKVKGFREVCEEACDTLYSVYTEKKQEEVDITYIPYHDWCNRGENEMRVYLGK